MVTKPPPPFPQRLAKQKEEAIYKKFLDLLKQVHLNVPLVDMLQGIPKYAKYIKDIMKNKSHFTEYDTVALTEECTSHSKQISYKVEGSRQFHYRNHDWKATRPEGIIEDVLVQVRSLICLTDFVILDFKPDSKVPFILGRPFLDTERALIDVAAR
ncbi:uncharacterized protein LOC132612855 [Lycium barbarum]|uniref:uncharacterized protein LOC132612855 n=1 Tax=Lycium barbarum TaxID=112863 RepID=UPI00293E2CB3|nr:uncharacterized protein LOC132612855 [Lycium barbarum]